MRKGEIVEFVAEIASVYITQLDRIPEFIFMIDTGYNKENAIKMFENMYKNKGIDLHAIKFSILALKHRPDLEVSAMIQPIQKSNATALQH